MSGIEIVSLAASVIQIAELAGKLSVKLFTFTRKLKNANKSIDALSHDIAATGAVLSQLGDTLSNDAAVKVCSQQAIDTAKTLVGDTKKVFTNLEKLVESDGKPTTKTLSTASLKQRLKFPFLEPQIEQLQANLERLKSSLLVILNVLIFAEQLRNKETLPVLKDQRELIKVLIDEKDENERRYQCVLKAITDSSYQQTRSVLDGPKSDEQISDQATIQVANALTLPLERDPESEDTREPLATHARSSVTASETSSIHIDTRTPDLEHFRSRIQDHSELVQNLLSQIKSLQYDLDYATRDRLHNGILDIHWAEWAQHRGIHGHNRLLPLLKGHTDVTRYWSDRYYLEPAFQPQVYQQHQVASRERVKHYHRHGSARSSRSASSTYHKTKRARRRRKKHYDDSESSVVSMSDTSRQDEIGLAERNRAQIIPPDVVKKLAKLELIEEQQRVGRPLPSVAEQLARLEMLEKQRRAREQISPETVEQLARSKIMEEEATALSIIRQREEEKDRDAQLQRLELSKGRRRAEEEEQEAMSRALAMLEEAESRAKSSKQNDASGVEQDIRVSPQVTSGTPRADAEEEEFISKVKERFIKAGYSPDYIEDIIEDKKRTSLTRTNEENILAVEAGRPTYIRVEIRYLHPETLDLYQLSWEYDPNDSNYLLVKEYISHEFLQELFAHTKEIKKQREKLLVSDGYTKETITTLKPRAVIKDEDAMYLVRRKDQRAALDEVDKLVLELTNIEESELRTTKSKGNEWLFT